MNVAAATGHTVPDFDPDEESFSDAQWDGSAAMSSFPNPSDDGTDMAEFRRNFVFAPEPESEAAANKSAYKGPIRAEHGGAVNENALEAVVAAINGARGGFADISEDTLQRGYNRTVALAVAAGLYDDRSDAPEFSAADAGDSSFEAGVAVSFTAAGTSATAADDGSDGDALTGVIWGAGTIRPRVNGRPQKVRVPADTIGPTFEALERRAAAGEATIGFDHPKEGSIAAETPLGEIGVVSEVARSADGEEIVLTDSELTNSKAIEAAEAGDFEGHDYSVVGKFVPRRTADGEPVRTDDGALDLEAVRIHRVDVVPDGAYSGASVGAMPALAERAGRIARASPGQSASGFAATLRAAAADIGDGRDADGNNGDNQHMSNNNGNGGSGSGNGDYPWNRDPETVEAAQSALDDASSLVEAKDNTIEELEGEKAALEGRAEGFEQIAASHGFDPDDEDFEAQSVIDAHTEDLRAEVARLEASLPKKDTGEEDIDDRAAELEGESVADLEARAGKLSREALRSEERAAELGGAIAASETPGSAVGGGTGNGTLGGGAGGGGSGSTSEEEANRVAAGCLDAEDSLAVQASDASPAEYVREHYDVDPAEHGDEDALFEAMHADATAGSGGDG